MLLSEDYELIDRYRLDDGRVFLSGSQALARLPLEQLRSDRRAGLTTAAYITGYPGSPLANYDRDVSAAAALATRDQLTMIAQPGLNEELAATAVMGSQLAVTLDSCRFDGIIGIWYGKGPGLDRASDAIRHAMFAGTSPHGGVVALVGDDPKAKSSTIPSSSDGSLIDLHLPLLYPGDVQETTDLGRHAITLSRASGLWTSIKIVQAVADGTGTIELRTDRIQPIIPHLEVGGQQFVPRPSGKLITPFTLDIEREIHQSRLEIARRYGIENRLNTIAVRGPSDWIGIVAAGHTYHETLEALRLLGLRETADLRNAGIRLLKLNFPAPLDEAIVREFANGLSDVVVVEERHPILERLVKDALYSLPDRPMVSGKRHPDGSQLFSPAGTLDADTIAPILRSCLDQRLTGDRLAPPPPAPRQFIPLSIDRTPYFCSGCPHSTSTQVPHGALIGGGIGCHTMVMRMEPERVGNVVGLTAMGNEGAQWFGMAPFVGESHFIQNIGDGTLFHSGMLAVRAAAANGVNITYKILYNGAVAMTGGQDPFGQLEVPSLVKALLAEGVQRIIITTDEVGRYRAIELPPDVKVWRRDRVIEAQEFLAAVPGCTVLIHDQRCAAVKRRDRKRGRIEQPPFKVVINERVCEGCGDCGDVSNCLSVQPVETAFGRKTRIDQDSCNFDLSCMQGDCPSFVTVVSSRNAKHVRQRTMAQPVDLPAPLIATVGEYTIRLSGIGGTGVVTVSQILGTAAMFDGYHVRGLDQTGLSQKAGPVVSDIRLSRNQPLPSNKASGGSVDVLIAFDQLVAASNAQIIGASVNRTVLIANSATTPTGLMVVHPDTSYPSEQLATRLNESTQDRLLVDAQLLVRGLVGNDSTTNVFLLGVAIQAGHVPVRPESIERAISLNGVAVDTNLMAFRWGRSWVVDSHAVERAAGIPTETVDETPLLERLSAELTTYQSPQYAARYRSIVDRVATAGYPEFTTAVAIYLHKLMAYKDEYEVARLLLLPEARIAAEAVGGKGAKVRWHLHPPMLRTLGMKRKIRLGPWATPIMWSLRAGRKLRGTPLDVFGWNTVRRTERALVREYIAAIDLLVQSIDSTNVAEAVAIASLPDRVRGYEHLKLERAEIYRTELARRCDAFTSHRGANSADSTANSTS